MLFDENSSRSKNGNIARNSPEDSGGSEEEEEYDEEEEEDVSQSYRDELLGVGDMSRHSISTPGILKGRVCSDFFKVYILNYTVEIGFQRCENLTYVYV